MVTSAQVREWCLGMPGVEEKPHFDRAAFRTKRAIFCTLLADGSSLNLKLSPVDQSVFAEIDPLAIFPVPNKWGLQGWTTFVLDGVAEDVLRHGLEVAHVFGQVSGHAFGLHDYGLECEEGHMAEGAKRCLNSAST
jgi:hypothetical protein